VLLLLYDAIAAEERAASLDNKLDRLIGMHYRAGKKWLEEASNQEALSIKQQYIERALEAFVNASVIEAPMNAARAEGYVGTCHGLLGRPDLRNFENSYSAFLAIEHTYLQGRFRTIVDCLDVYGNSKKQYVNQMQLLGRIPTRTPNNRQITELYGQIHPLAALLASRRSQHAEMRPPDSFTLDGFWQRYAGELENYCGRPFRQK
jgi:hypothetical protein